MKSIIIYIFVRDSFLTEKYVGEDFEFEVAESIPQCDSIAEGLNKIGLGKLDRYQYDLFTPQRTVKGFNQGLEGCLFAIELNLQAFLENCTREMLKLGMQLSIDKKPEGESHIVISNLDTMMKYWKTDCRLEKVEMEDEDLVQMSIYGYGYIIGGEEWMSELDNLIKSGIIQLSMLYQAGNFPMLHHNPQWNMRISSEQLENFVDLEEKDIPKHKLPMLIKMAKVHDYPKGGVGHLMEILTNKF